MKNTKEELRRITEIAGIRHRSDLLLEEEDLFGGGDEEEEGGDEEGGDEAEDEEAGDEEAGEEEEEPEEEEEQPEKLSAKEIADLGHGNIEQEINDMMLGIFDDSSKSLEAKAQTENIHRNSMTSILFEQAGVPYEEFDMTRFASETARLINHYDTIMDIEGMLFNKAKQTLLNQFGDQGQSAVVDFEEHMARVHGVDLTNSYEENLVQPVAAGAAGEGGAA